MAFTDKSKLTNPSSGNEAKAGPKSRFNNGKKRLTCQCASSGSNSRARRAETCGKSRAPATGTARATKDTVLSATTAGAETPPSARKIGQFRVGRRSTALRSSEVRNIMAAAVFTAQEHRPLNRHTTIHFDAAGIDQPVRAIGQYLKLASDWLRTRAQPFAYIWVRESGDRKGEHVHILMHVPPRLAKEFALRERRWRKRIGARPARGAFRSTPVGRSYRHGDLGIQFGESYRDHLNKIVGYLVKGAEPVAAKALGLVRVAPGGELRGKRTGMSENIGRAARSRSLK